MEPIKKVRLSERVIDAIREMIVEDNFKPGDKFYSENELTKKLEVSRSSIREAVRILEATGLVTVKHGKGIFISNSMKQEMEAFSNWLKNNETALIEHFEVRLIIDPKAAAASARNADQFEIEKMEEVCNDFYLKTRENNIAGLIKCDEEFHRLLAKSTKNKTLYFVMKTMTNSLSEGWISSLHVPGRTEKTVGEHKDILDAIKQGDPDRAEQAMVVHLKNAVADIRASMNVNN
jgi:GntR family transcriptional regulator, transcriptional repressor for pyruvate dehydrogenase complex